MTDFKLIAIRPMSGCTSHYTKVLEPGIVYPFYQGYQFYNAGGREALPDDEIAAVSLPGTSGLHLHDLSTADNHPLRINISAVVGKNGSGKSTLMELFFAAVYLISVSEEILDDTPKSLREQLKNAPGTITYRQEQLQKSKDVREKIGNEYEHSVKQKKEFLSFEKLTERIAAADELISVQEDLLKKMDGKEKWLRRQLREMLAMAAEVQVEIYYQINRAVFCVQVKAADGEPACNLFKLQRTTAEAAEEGRTEYARTWLPFSAAVITKHFFYTVAVNYSHYALNAKHMGDWINSLFHKNDGYKTPVVINPMRNDGNFDINKELALGKQRLLANLLVQRHMNKDLKERIKLTDQLKVYRVWLTVDKDKVKEQQVLLTEEGLTGPKREKGLLQDLFHVFFQDKDFADQLPVGSGLAMLALNYILEKIESIRENYDGLGHFNLDSEGRSAENRRFFKQLRDEPSHITFKFKQAVNFLRRLANPKWPKLFEIGQQIFDSGKTIVFKPSLEDLLIWTGDPGGWEMINYLPPPIFKIDFELIGLDKPSFFNDLSSGEQQMIHTVQTVLYHLNNLQSVGYSKLPRLPYRAVNLVFDEIELYFHPAYQRSFINELYLALKRLYIGVDNTLETINMIFLTHSPFILSDIPQDHITLLAVDKDTGLSQPSAPESQTFAANINELLAGSFFLNGTLMGEFAEAKVNDLIESIRLGNSLSKQEESILDLIGDSYLQNSLRHFLRRRYDQN
ncbi:hypothetical protein [Mucilaginibacter dorajii]|uniref:ATPase AAA-type core domain-containing protein n=1 Tax=Mucilaginibacter dorajii TaxID=692994 RepID=A0ABP7R681_9SPHI|nr:hypothetical protein [Mucilaginibacter dorajii]MCS3737696.1 putative ATP-binding protein involved in virulence [Mucilaginibacter dorajii]